MRRHSPLSEHGAVSAPFPLHGARPGAPTPLLPAEPMFFALDPDVVEFQARQARIEAVVADAQPLLLRAEIAIVAGTLLIAAQPIAEAVMAVLS